MLVLFLFVNVLFPHAVMGSREHPLSNLFVEGSVASDGESYGENIRKKDNSTAAVWSAGPGGGSGGTILAFLSSLDVSESGILSSAGGHGSQNGGGGGGGTYTLPLFRHTQWRCIPANS